MALGRSEETALIQSLYTAATRTGVAGWRTFLEALARESRADCAAMIVRQDEAQTVCVVGKVTGFDPAEIWSDDGPIGLGRLRTGRVYSRDDTPGLLPDIAPYLRAVRVGSEDMQVWLILMRRHEDFRAIDSATLSSLVPHIQTAAPIWAVLCMNSLEFDVLKKIAASLSTSWIALDKTARIVIGSKQLKTSAKRLIFLDPETERQFSKRFQKTLTDATPQAITIDQSNRIEVLLYPAATDGIYGPAESTIAVIGLVRDCSTVDASPATTAQTLDLALSEARLAVCLSNGLTISESAEKLGLTIETARNYSRKIYQKTGTKGQADLVRQVLNGVSAFGS